MRIYIFLAQLCLLVPLFLNGQSCGGSLGENIFTDGNFGSGNENILSTDPGIAPGYNYDNNPPLWDGDYIITNNMNIGSWVGTNYNTWLSPSDNSSDPQGYFMVVNASFDPGLFYQQTIDGLCDNTIYEFSADIINMIKQGVANHIRPNVSFLIDGVVQFSTGDIPQNNRWNTYGFVFETEPGQTSITLALQNNSPGGIGNDLGLDNIAFRPCGPLALVMPETAAKACEENFLFELTASLEPRSTYPTPAFQWQQSFDQGQTWVDLPGETDSVLLHTQPQSGLYYYRYYAANSITNLANTKCRIISDPKIVEIVPKFYTHPDTFCVGNTYDFGNRILSQSGVYVDTFVSSIGCDSIVTLELYQVADPGIAFDVAVEDLSCWNKEDGSIALADIRNGTEPYTIELEGYSTVSASLYTFLPAGPYEIKVRDRYGCDASQMVEIAAPDSFWVSLGEDSTIKLGETIRLSPQSNYPVNSYQWLPDKFDCVTANCAETDWLLGESTQVIVHVETDRACKASDTVIIEVIRTREVYFPTAFTPNADTHNDFFFLIGPTPQIAQIDFLAIYNRWGIQVFFAENIQPNDPQSGWDGYWQGRPVPEGVYMYKTEVRYLDGAVYRYDGSITLIR